MPCTLNEDRFGVVFAFGVLSMTTGIPDITVVMPVCNGGSQLVLAVRSIQHQTFQGWEMLLLDDGSTDRAIDAISDLQDPRIKIIRHGESRGVAVRLNQGIAVARGRFIARMDADDIAFPQRFEKQFALLTRDETLDMVGTGVVSIDQNNRLMGVVPREIQHDAICARPWMGFHLVHPSWMGRTTWFRANPYEVPAPYSCEDQELLLRTCRLSKFGCVPEVLLAYRLRPAIDWIKLSRTRKAMLNFQYKHFQKTCRWHFSALAVACYILKKGWDLCARIQGKNFFPGVNTSLPVQISDDWAVIIKSLMEPDVEFW